MKKKRSKSSSASDESVIAVPVVAEAGEVLIDSDAPTVVALDAQQVESLLAGGEQTSAKADAATVIVLAENCTLRDAHPLKNQLLEAFHEESPVTLDINAVHRIETANLQLLASFVRGRRKAGRGVRWIGSSSAFTQAVELLGLGAVLDAPNAAQK